MADIQRLSRLVAGIQRQVDLGTNSLVAQSLKLTDDGGSTSTELTKTILTNLKALQDGSDFSTGTNSHTHDGRYFTEAELSSTVNNSSGASKIGTPTIRSSAEVESVLEALDSALATAETTLSGHLDGGASKHDATETDYERSDGSKKDIQATSDDVESALNDLDDNKISKTGSIAFTGDQSMGGFKLTSLGTPASDTDAATKAYVDATASGLDVKKSVRATTTAALPAATYNNGTSGVGATLTADVNGALAAQDGVTLSVGQRLLVKDQASALQNGIYTVTDVGSVSTPWILTRATDSDTSTEMNAGMFTFVEEGTSNADSGWVLTTDDLITIGTTGLSFSQFSGAGQITAGAGLTKTGNTIDVVAADTSITVNADSIQVNPATGGGLKVSSGLAVEPADFAGSGLEDDGSDNLRIATSAAGAGLTGGGGSALAVNFSTTFSEVDKAIAAADLASTASGKGASVIGVEDSGGFFTATTVEGALAELAASTSKIETVSEDMTAGEAITSAGGPYALRMAITSGTSETSGRVYKADPTELSLGTNSKDPFHVIGLANPGADVSTGGTVEVVKMGKMTVTAHGFAVGEPVFLNSNGTLTSTAPSVAGEASVIVAMARDANTLEVQIQKMGVN